MRKKLLVFLLAMVAGVGTTFASDTQVNGIWYDFDDANLTASVTYRGNSSEEYSELYEGEIVIPSKVSYNGKTYTVTKVGSFACWPYSDLTSVVLPNTLTEIGSYAFGGSSMLVSINIPNGVTSIGTYAFYGCTSLVSLDIPNSVMSIGSQAFYGITNINYSGSATPESYSSNYWGAKCMNAFIDGDLLYADNTKEVLVGCSSSAEEIVIPESVTSIRNGAFSYCSSLTSVTIPNSVTSIGEAAFAYCSGLTSITCEAITPPTLGSRVFSSVDKSIPLYVLAGSVSAYKSADQWKDFTNILPISAQGTETTSVQAEPTDNSVSVSWPQVSGAATYELVIKDKSGNVICTLIFNSNGQLTQIAFNVPARNNAPQQTQAAGFSFTVTGLENGTSYDLTITSKDNSGTTLDTKTISFTTSGEAPQGIDQVSSDQVQSTKLLHDGQIFILRGEKVYTVTGQEVK